MPEAVWCSCQHRAWLHARRGLSCFGCLCCVLQQFVGALPSSDVLLTLPVKSGLVSISYGHHDLLLLQRLIRTITTFLYGAQAPTNQQIFQRLSAKPQTAPESPYRVWRYVNTKTDVDGTA